MAYNSPFDQPGYRAKAKATKKKRSRGALGGPTLRERMERSERERKAKEKAKKRRAQTKKKTKKTVSVKNKTVKKKPKPRKKTVSVKGKTVKKGRPAWPQSAAAAGWEKTKAKAKRAPAKKRLSAYARDLAAAKAEAARDAAAGVRVHCVQVGGRTRVRPVPGQGYASTKNVQFPRHLRHEGCQYVVDDLDDKGTYYRAVGEIRHF